MRSSTARRLARDARGIHDLANAAMMRALRAVSTEKGRDPADFVLVAYGGSGPVHAAALAAELGARTAIVPPLAGVFSAAGLLFARAECHDVRFCRDRRARARPRRCSGGSMPRCAPTRDGGEPSGAVADVRYRGQSWSVPIELPGEIDAARSSSSSSRFEARARAALRHAARARLADRHPRAPPRRARARATREPFRADRRRAARRGRGSPTSAPAHGARDARVALADDLHRARRRDRCSSTSTTRRSSCRPAGPCASTATRARSSSTTSA